MTKILFVLANVQIRHRGVARIGVPEGAQGGLLTEGTLPLNESLQEEIVRGHTCWGDGLGHLVLARCFTMNVSWNVPTTRGDEFTL